MLTFCDISTNAPTHRGSGHSSLFFALALAWSLVSCQPIHEDIDPYQPAPVGSYAKGADCSWLTEQEHDGVLFYDSLGQSVECMRLMRSYGMNSVRLRVFVNHRTGWCNQEDVVNKAIRATQLGLRVMIDFHYSDYFADPSKQYAPAAWACYDIDSMLIAVREHTTNVLSVLQQQGVQPEWVQVGNETRPGMLWPVGRLYDSNGDISGGWSRYAQLTTAGYEAVHSVFPEASVIVHIDNAYQNNNWFFRRLRQEGGRFDMIGLSHYPMMKQWSGKEWEEMNRLCRQHIEALYHEFQCPVMLCEIGALASNPELAAEVLADVRQQIDTLPGFAGIFYWEPQVYHHWKPAEYVEDGWDAYDMGAFTSHGTPSIALQVLWQ